MAKTEPPPYAARHSGTGAHVCMIAYTNYATDARVRREAETLAAGGFHVRCLTIHNGDGPARYTLKDVDVQELGVAKYRGKSRLAYLASYLRFLLASSLSCLRLLRRGELDVVHVHNLPDFLVFAGLVPRFAGKTVILDVHDSVPETFASKFSDESFMTAALRLEERLSALVAHRVICVNHPQRDALVARGLPLSKTFVSMNMPDPSIFTVRPVVAPAAPGDFNLVYHGTMAARLGVDLLIRAFAKLRERVPSAKLHLWGHGDDLASFEQLAREIAVFDYIDFKPKGLPLDELPHHLSAMTVGVIGNRRSAASDLMLPVKLLEYIALDIPAVVPRLKTIEHYLTDDMVSFYEPEDIGSQHQRREPERPTSRYPDQLL